VSHRGVLAVESDGPVRILTLNRPEVRNALDQELVAALVDALYAAEQAPEVRAVVIAGSGSCFCSGADLRELPSVTGREALARADAALELTAVVPSMRTPVLAAVEGAALAGGCGLAMTCDMVVAADSAVFGYPEITRGLVPSLTMVGLAALVGRRVAIDLLLTGRRVAAREALELGMITEVVGDGDALRSAIARATALSERDPAAVGSAKELFYSVADLPFPAALRQARNVNLLMRRTDAARRGAQAFLEGRG